MDESRARASDAETRGAIPRSRRWFILASVAVVLVSLGVSIWHWWTSFLPQPVVPTDLTANGIQRILNGGAAFRNLPFCLAAEEEAALKECEQLGRSVRFLHNDQAQFDRDEVRARLEAILTEHPQLFHADSLLALWHRRRGNKDLAEQHMQQALKKAPVILVQRFQFADGSPLVGSAIREIQIECNRVQKGSLDPSLKLTFFDLTTDADGCVYLPVYRTIYRLYSIAHPEGFALELPRLGWFETRSKVGILPAATVARKE